MIQNRLETKEETLVDKIIKRIRIMIQSGDLNPGDRLPSERKLANHLNVSRTHVRDAISKLEFYGILKTLPQSGTFVEGLGITAIEGLITDILEIDNNDFDALVETRVLLETETARFAAQRRTTEDIIKMKTALDDYEAKVKTGLPAVEEDLLFHLKIAEAAKNNVLKSLMLVITPDIVKNFTKLDVCKDGRFYRSLEEHKILLKHIVNQEPELAATAMKGHLKDVIDYSKSLKNR